jgi:putative transposase
MLFSLLYFLVRRLLGAGGRLQDEKEVELLVLRHQVKVLQRQVKRPRLNRLDRVFLAVASRALTRSSWSSFVVRPETLLRWHRELVRKKWTQRRTGHPGRRSNSTSGTSSSASAGRTPAGGTSGSAGSC